MKNMAEKTRKELLQRALELTAAGISVIPVYGDSAPREPKRPAMKWRAFQQRVMTKREVRTAFAGEARALGIVCGRVSGLVVVDFDDHLRYRRFCRHRPDLAQSYTVKTRRGYHVYFRTSEKVPTHQFDGGDIKGERSYVVAPPSVIAGFVYERVNGRESIELDRAGVDGLLSYFHVSQSEEGLARVPVATGAELDVCSLYARLYPRMGRNNALYRVASLARDRGLKRADVERRLVMRHALALPRNGHKRESQAARIREAHSTVKSAYASSSVDLSSGAVPNSVREKLLCEQRSTVMPRLLDIMAMAGWGSDAYFTMSQAIELCAGYGLNRKSVMAALTGECSSFDGRHIVVRRYVEYLDMRGLKSSGRGRPVELMFQVPSAGRLLSLLNVPMSPCDRIGAQDLASAHAYRRALHREYIRRLSPEASNQALGSRLGVDARTIRRYNRELGVRSTRCVSLMELSWQRLKCLPRRRRKDRAWTAGYWLETAEGYRAPAWRHVGAALLRRGEAGLKVCLQGSPIRRLSGDAESVRYEEISPAEFTRLRLLRDGGYLESNVRRALRRLVSDAKKLAAKVRYQKLGLTFASVAERIAEDKIAETISGFLLALDGRAREVRRPMRRGVAYRMLKEFGEGKVFLALRESAGEVRRSLAGHAAREGSAAGLDLLAPMLS